MKNNVLNSKNGSIDISMVDSSTIDDPFQPIIEKAGNHGRFQLIFNVIFVMSLSIMGSMMYMNIILALNVPDHWCTVPGRETTNFTLSEWQKLTLPTTKDNRGAEKYSSCEMYDVDFTEIDDWEHWNSTAANVTVCKNGWTYDRTWFKHTVPTRENWVCEKDLYVTNIFVAGRVAEVVGSFLLGQMGDIFGRRIVYYVSVLLSSFGRISSILTTSHYIWFLIVSCLTSFSINSVFQSPHVIGMEISRDEDRSLIAMYHNFGWSVGITMVPLLFWWLRDWESFMWISSVPALFFLLIYKYAIESPRWLISKKRFGDAITQLKKIAKVNGRQFDMTEKDLAQIYCEINQEATYGFASMFSGWRLAKNTLILGFSRCVVGISYFTIVLFSTAISGNPFLNFLLQSVAEIPAYFMGRYLGDKFGRRFTNSFSAFISCLTCVLIIILAVEKKYEFIVMGLASFVKFLNAVSYFTASLQGMEIYPTCMRQTGCAFGTILGNSAGTLAPYLVYLSTTVDIRCPYYILATLFLISSVGTLFLPETLHKKLPDTMEEARQFGVNDKFFSLPKAPAANHNLTDKKSSIDITALEKLNQDQYAP
ncbi:carcinine transporter-like [Lucilia cuprina]|uniref:carcinine transporter-like n=1 Tax=Lucilia cuprina TaxID=7375 RepID=UPI001F062254|nr:carcinine transporter-like [Lucilia cuprina]